MCTIFRQSLNISLLFKIKYQYAHLILRAQDNTFWYDQDLLPSVYMKQVTIFTLLNKEVNINEYKSSYYASLESIPGWEN